MSTTDVSHSSLSSSDAAAATPARAVLLAGLAVGVLDAVDNLAYFAVFAGKNPIEVLQFISSAAMGPAAFQGGLATAGLGALLHFVIAFVAAFVYITAYRRVAVVRESWVATGLAFGAAVWAVMNLIVVPLSAIGQFPSFGAAIHGIVGHSLTVGLASAFVTRRTLALEPA
jgi:hypothetical protein